MSTFGWDQMAYWWDEKQGDEGDLWHRALIDPPLLRLAGEVRGLHVLDLACGNGYLTAVGKNLEPSDKMKGEKEARR